MADPRIKKLQIQTGVLKRTVREKVYYEKELITEQNRLNKIIADGGDEHVVRKQHEVIGETEMLLPDCAKRIKTAFDTLTNLVNECETDLNETEQFLAAKSQLAEVSIPAN